MNKLSLFIMVAVLCMAAKAQTPYYFYNFEGKKVYLNLHTKNAFLSLNTQQIPLDVQQRGIRATPLKSDRTGEREYQGKRGTNRFYTVLTFDEKLTDEQYLKALSDIKRQNRDAILSPFFTHDEAYFVGLSNFFYVKLKEASDTTALRQMAERTGAVIVEQDEHMPLWFVLSATGASEMNAIEYCNLFNESGLFRSAEPSAQPSTSFLSQTPVIPQRSKESH